MVRVARDLSRIMSGGTAPDAESGRGEVQRALASFFDVVTDVCTRMETKGLEDVAQAALWCVRFDLKAPYEGDAWDVWAVLTRQPGARANCVAGSVLVALCVWAALPVPDTERHPFAVFACEEHCYCGTVNGKRIFETIHASWMDGDLFSTVLELPAPGTGLSVFSTYGGLARLLVASAASQAIVSGKRELLARVVAYGKEHCATDSSPDVMIALAEAENEPPNSERRKEAARHGLGRIPASSRRFNARNYQLLAAHAGAGAGP